MKKLLKLCNVIALVGVINILLYLAPAIKISNNASGVIEAEATLNLFTASFGGGYTVDYGGITSRSYSAHACAGLIIAFVFAIIAIILTVLKNKKKMAGLLACPFYLTSGILVACASPLTFAANYMVEGSSPLTNYSIQGGAITVATIFFILAAFIFIDFIASIAKPRPQQVAY